MKIILSILANTLSLTIHTAELCPSINIPAQLQEKDIAIMLSQIKNENSLKISSIHFFSETIKEESDDFMSGVQLTTYFGRCGAGMSYRFYKSKNNWIFKDIITSGSPRVCNKSVNYCE